MWEKLVTSKSVAKCITVIWIYLITIATTKCYIFRKYKITNISSMCWFVVTVSKPVVLSYTALVIVATVLSSESTVPPLT